MAGDGPFPAGKGQLGRVRILQVQEAMVAARTQWRLWAIVNRQELNDMAEMG